MLNPSHGDYKIDAKPCPATLCTHGFVITILRYQQTKNPAQLNWRGLTDCVFRRIHTFVQKAIAE